MNKQEMFDKLYEHFVVNKAPKSLASHDDRATCVYNGEGGTHCAIGLFIQDIPIDAGRNGSSVRVLLADYPELKERFEGMDEDYLARVQTTLHDKLESDQHARHMTYARFALAEHLQMPANALVYSEYAV